MNLVGTFLYIFGGKGGKTQQFGKIIPIRMKQNLKAEFRLHFVMFRLHFIKPGIPSNYTELLL